jgi:hypothetical protein
MYKINLFDEGRRIIAMQEEDKGTRANTQI